MKNFIYFLMQKKGQVETIVLAGAVVVIILVSLFGTYNIVSQNRFVGDPETKLVYDLKYCDIKGVSNNKLIPFPDKEKAYEEDFKDAPCNR